jgi:hypothetical protein
MSVSLTVKDMGAVVLLVAPHAMTVLTYDGIRTALHHSAAEPTESWRGITAKLLTAVIYNDNVTVFVFSLDYIRKSVFIVGTAAHPIGKSVGILMLANCDYRHPLAVKFKYQIPSGIGII